jgi:hypothetical protein
MLQMTHGLDNGTVCAKHAQRTNPIQNGLKFTRLTPKRKIISGKTLHSIVILFSALFFSPSLRAEIVNVYEQTTLSGDASGYTGNWGNSFQNINSASKLKSITLFLSNNGMPDSDTGEPLYATGTLKLDIFAATGGNGNWTPYGSSMGTASADRTFTGDYSDI